jgi:hypothetical protein
MKCDAFAERRLEVVHLLGQVWERLESLRTRSPNLCQVAAEAICGEAK